MTDKIKHIILFFLVMAGLVVVFSFAVAPREVCSGHSATITLESKSQNYFINTSCIENIIREHTGVYEGRAICKKTHEQLYHILESITFAENVTTYRTVTGRLGVEVRLRNPIIRIVNNKNESFYIDERGYIFPLSDKHTARVMIATGDIPTMFSAGKNIAHALSEHNDPDAVRMSGLFETASFIHGDDFLKAFIDHIYVLPNGKLELIPKNAFHTIEFGYPEHIAEKFRKLKVFYSQALSQKGWHHYSKINLEYSNQIICSK